MKRKKAKVAQAISLPAPTEIAKIAAILSLSLRRSPEKAIDHAIRLLFRTTLRYNELHKLGLVELAEKLGDLPVLDLIAGTAGEYSNQARWVDTLEFDRAQNDDPARQFLAEKGVRLKAPGVVKNIRCYYGPKALEKCKRIKNRKEVFAIPRFILEGVAAEVISRDREKKRKSYHKRQQAKLEAVKKNLQKSPV